MDDLTKLKLILSEHKSRLALYKKDGNIHGINHSKKMVFDFTCRIFVIESFLNSGRVSRM